MLSGNGGENTELIILKGKEPVTGNAMPERKLHPESLIFYSK
jgi:hypothetical protein